MSEHYADIETMLRRALSPVDPPKEFEVRLDHTLGELVGIAADELEAWELSAMRDPRNWVRPVAAAARQLRGDADRPEKIGSDAGWRRR